MKKIFIALAALATIAACNKAEVIETQENDAISFNTPFVDNATKAAQAAHDPSYGAQLFTQFNVWGTANGVAIFAGEKVTGEVGQGKVWHCEKKQYWVNGVDYNFAAVANGEVTPGDDDKLPATISYTANGTSDLIYAENKGIKGKPAGSNSPVALTFSHLLAKVKFTATTNTDIEGYSYTVSDITINNAYDSGVYTIEDESWDSLVKTNGKSFGSITVNKDVKKNECAQEMLLIPISATEKVSISCKMTLNYGGNAIWEETASVTVDTGLLAANAYNFTIGLNVGEEITFSVEKNAAWSEDNNQTIYF